MEKHMDDTYMTLNCTAYSSHIAIGASKVGLLHHVFSMEDAYTTMPRPSTLTLIDILHSITTGGDTLYT